MNQNTPPETDPAPGPAGDAPGGREPEPGVESPPAAPQRSAGRRGSGVGWLALLIALLAAGGSAYLWTGQQAQRQTKATVARIDDSLRAQDKALTDLQARLASLMESDARLSDGLDSLDERLSSQRRQLDELPARVGRLERALEALPGVADEARSAWLLAEAEYYLRIGNAQLGLARNVDVALRALELADEKLRDIGDPGLTRVRSLLADEMTALRGVPRPDAEGIVLRLGSLARSLEQLPLSRQTPERYGQQRSEGVALSGWQRAWQSVKDALLSIVRIKRTDETVTPLRSTAEESLLLQGMATELDIARLALIRGDNALYRDALAGVTRRLDRHFDGQSSAVSSARAQLVELAGAQLPESLPDISGSLNLLVRYGTDAASP